MAHVGIQRFCASQTKEHRAQRNECDPIVVHYEARGIGGENRLQHGRVVDDLQNAKHANGQKPQNSDGAKKFADVACAPSLHQKEACQHDQGDWNHIGLGCGGNDFQTFYGRQDRNGWRNDAIAKEQRNAENSQEDENAAHARFAFGGK